MQIHEALAARLTTALGVPMRSGAKHTWHIDVGLTTINVILDLPSDSRRSRLWLFDPRKVEGESVMDFAIETVTEVDAVVAEVLQRARCTVHDQA